MPVCPFLWPAAMLSYHATAAGKEGEGEGGRGRDILPLACNHIAYTERGGRRGYLASLPVPLACSHVVLPYNCCRERRRGGRREGERYLATSLQPYSIYRKRGRRRGYLSSMPVPLACSHVVLPWNCHRERRGGRREGERYLATSMQPYVAYTQKEGEGGGYNLASMPVPLACSHVVLPCNHHRERRSG